MIIQTDMQYFKTNNKHFKGIMRRHETVDTLGQIVRTDLLNALQLSNATFLVWLKNFN